MDYGTYGLNGGAFGELLQEARDPDSDVSRIREARAEIDFEDFCKRNTHARKMRENNDRLTKELTDAKAHNNAEEKRANNLFDARREAIQDAANVSYDLLQVKERAEKAEAEVVRLTKMVDWLADKLGTRHPDCPLKYLKQRPLGWKCHEGSQGPCTKSQSAGCWAEAARHAVPKQPVSNAATALCPICGQSGHIGDCEED